MLLVLPGENRFLQASEKNKQRAIRWINSILPAGGADSYGALKAGMQRFPHVDTIFFHSDDKPSRGALTDPGKSWRASWR